MARDAGHKEIPAEGARLDKRHPGNRSERCRGVRPRHGDRGILLADLVEVHRIGVDHARRHPEGGEDEDEREDRAEHPHDGAGERDDQPLREVLAQDAVRPDGASGTMASPRAPTAPAGTRADTLAEWTPSMPMPRAAPTLAP
jgi:hypothetical protein